MQILCEKVDFDTKVGAMYFVRFDQTSMYLSLLKWVCLLNLSCNVWTKPVTQSNGVTILFWGGGQNIFEKSLISTTKK